MSAPQWKVRELIEELQKHDPDAMVWTEGCDCWGTCYGIEIDKTEPKSILLKRSN